MIFLIARHLRAFLKLWLSAVALHFFYFHYFNNHGGDSFNVENTLKNSHQVESFQESWCQIHRARVNLDQILRPCFYNISWNGPSPTNRELQTDAAKSLISFFVIRPAGQFSRFSIQTKTWNSKLKRIGGDSWRVLLRDPATVSPTMFDHGNGTYEFLFLVMDPGVYMLDVTLDYSLCEGYREPPNNWFIVGNSHGKLQREGTLGKNRARDDYLLQPFQNGKLTMINIPLPTDGGTYLINRLHRQSRMNTQCLSLSANFDLTCGVGCKFMWDGFGRWVGKNWRPYLTDISNRSQFKSTSPRKLGTLWLFGDSNAERLYVSLKDGPLCNNVFKVCNLSKMWVYPWPSIQPVAWDDKNFDSQQILDHIRGVLERPEMDENSAMILNLGLHYMESTNFANYRIFLKGVTELLNQRDKKSGKLRYKTRVIWKTTTSMNKEKDIGSRLKSDWQRFLNPARVILYNTFATSLMCQAGLEVLDVYPFTRSYPGGTGGPEVAHYREQDTVHFKYIAMKPIDIFLEDYFRGKVPLSIDFRNYQFS